MRNVILRQIYFPFIEKHDEYLELKNGTYINNRNVFISLFSANVHPRAHYFFVYRLMISDIVHFHLNFIFCIVINNCQPFLEQYSSSAKKMDFFFEWTLNDKSMLNYRLPFHGSMKNVWPMFEWTAKIHLVHICLLWFDTFYKRNFKAGKKKSRRIFILNHHSIIINVTVYSMCRCHMTLAIYMSQQKWFHQNEKKGEMT